MKRIEMRLFTMIIWRGKGGLVFLSLILGVLITNLVLSFLPSDPLADGYKMWYILKGIITTIIIALINYGNYISVYTNHNI